MTENRAALMVRCPYCHEPRWSWCRDFRGFPTARLHKTRGDFAAATPVPAESAAGDEGATS